MKENKYKIIIFTVDAVYMILELVASRVLSPYFGVSNIVWTSIIGIILLSNSVGNYLGGKLADKNNNEKRLKNVLVAASISTMIIPYIQRYILEHVSVAVTDIKLASIITTIILFFIPSLFIGMVTPIILKLELDSINTVGKKSGKITAISTIGGIFGTFLGGFVLIPTIGSSEILFVLAIVLITIALFIDFRIKGIRFPIIIITITLSIISICVFSYKNSLIGNKILEGSMHNFVSYDTQYGRVVIYNSKKNNENVRILNIDSGYESVTYTEEDKINELALEYSEYYNLMFDANIEINDVLLIGGGGYSYPKYYISHYPEKKMDVVEIDEDITKIAKKYFYLDKLIEDYDLENNKRLNFITDDGRIFLNKNTKKYDAILNDAFSGNTPAKTLTTIECIQNIKKSLNENGLYLSNIISALEGDDSKFIKAEVATLKQVFKNVYVFRCYPDDDINLPENNMVIATDDDNLTFENAYDLDITSNKIILTDEYCPIDTLIPKTK